MMKDYQQRVVDERAELDAKISRLNSFIISKPFASVPKEERERLQEQIGTMRKYSDILAARIAYFE